MKILRPFAPLRGGLFGLLGITWVLHAEEPVRAPSRHFDRWQDGVQHGRVFTEEYPSRRVGTRRSLVVYQPPGYTPSLRYPVLYLLHGMSDDETAWTRRGALEPILDNLYSDGRVVPMLVVMPNGRASRDVDAESPWDRQAASFLAFEEELLDTVIPFVESRFRVLPDREHRALAGVSIGARQALLFGIAHPDRFSWIGAFSPTGPIPSPDKLTSAPRELSSKLRILSLSVGDQDPVSSVAVRFHEQLDALGVRHQWQSESGGHTWTVWKRDLHRFAQQVFR
jgi:enterochelin esterase-like enzyme